MPNQGSTTDCSALAEKLKRSRHRLLDLTLRNRLLNFRAGDPDFNDDLRGHKHLRLKGRITDVWEAVVEDGKKAEILCLTKDQQFQLQQEADRRREWSRREVRKEIKAISVSHSTVWDEAAETIRGVAANLSRGNLYSLLPQEAFTKRLKKIRGEQNTLIDSTGDSALFLAVGFLEWAEDPPHPKAGKSLFAPLLLIHIHLDEVKAADGGERHFVLEMDLDQAQDNPCLLEKLRQDFSIDLPRLGDDDTADNYLARVRKALKSKKTWNVHNNLAIGFFNFARYRLWLDLDPQQWPDGKDPGNHSIVQAILNGEALEQTSLVPSEQEVAEHQQNIDLPLVLDADSTQYASLLAAVAGTSLVVVGPPGSGKSQTITNLIAVATNQGKRVLFIAQKLAALSVVQRRLEQVGLLPYCLPLFSDKARATELHKHITSSPPSSAIF
jgi:hypothetical protein